MRIDSELDLDKQENTNNIEESNEQEMERWNYIIFYKKILAKFLFLSDKWNEEKKPLNINNLKPIKHYIRSQVVIRVKI